MKSKSFFVEDEGLGRKVRGVHTELGIVTGSSGKPEGTVGISDLSVEGAGRWRRSPEKEVDSGVGPPLTNMAFSGWPELTLS